MAFGTNGLTIKKYNIVLTSNKSEYVPNFWRHPSASWTLSRPCRPFSWSTDRQSPAGSGASWWRWKSHSCSPSTCTLSFWPLAVMVELSLAVVHFPRALASATFYICSQTKSFCQWNLLETWPSFTASQRKNPQGNRTTRADAIIIIRPVSF